MNIAAYVSAEVLRDVEDLLTQIEALGPSAAPSYIDQFEAVADDPDASSESRTQARLLLAGTRVIGAGGNWRDAELALVREQVRVLHSLQRLGQWTAEVAA